MEVTTPNYARRRLVVMFLLSALAAAAGFTWGQMYGYDQGKRDMLKLLKDRVEAASAPTPMPG